MSVGEPQGSVSLGTHSTRGLAYLFAGATAAKFIGLAAQVVLLYLLGRSDFGVVSLAYTISLFIQLIAQTGVGDVLVHRRAFHQWAIPGFWLALALGAVSCLLITIAAPIASLIYGRDEAVRDQLFWVLLVLAPSPLPYALSVVPRAQLSRQLRFGTLAAVNLADVTLQNGLTVLFAWLGFGPFSFVLPTPIAGLLITAFLWIWVRPPWSPQLRLRRWKFLIGDSTQLLAADFGRLLLDQSDYVLLGIFRTVSEVGVYAVGFRLSIQMVRLLMVNLTNILFPAFTKLNDQPHQQYEGFFRAQRILAMVGISGCLLQAAVAKPFAHLLFPAEWEPSIIVMQILSLGMATRMLAGASFALLKSQGRFKTIRTNFWAWAFLQIVVLTAVLWMGGGVVEVAIVVSIISALTGPVMFYFAIRPHGGGWADVAHVLGRPLACGILSVGTAWLIAEGIAARGHGDIAQLSEILLVAAVLNIALARLWMRPVWDDLWLRIRRLRPSRAVA